MSRVRTALIAALACALMATLAPAAVSAATFTVDNTGDLPSGPGAACGAGEGCSLRAAIEAANADSVKDAIDFDATVFKGDAGSTIAPATLLPEITQPATVDGGLCSTGGGDAPCAAIKGFSGFATIAVKANETEVEHLKFEGGSLGIRIQAPGGPGLGAEILENTFTGSGNAISSISGSNLIEGNEIDVPTEFNFGITISNGPNRVYGNVINGGGCCYTAIWLSGSADGNKIGGDTAASENVINGFSNGAIRLMVPGSTRNEIGRNRGENGGQFISLGTESANGGIEPPAITSPLQSSASGTAEPGAKVRVFRKATEWEGEIEGFLAEAVADSSGNWKASFAAIPVGTFVTATQTLDGGTSELAAAATTAADPPTPPDPPDPPVPPTCANTPSMCVKPDTPGRPGPAPAPAPTPTPAPAPDVTKPVVTVKKAPKPKSAATTATFRFTVDEAGSAFQCKLDKKAWAKCGSPKTYRNLQPGKHVFKVKATDAAGNVGAVVTRRFTVLA